MFRGIKINNNLDVKIELWRNKDEILSEIPVEWCKEINYTFGEPTQLQLEIPKYVMKNSEKVLNNLYNKIKIRQQLIVEIDGERERFIISEQSAKIKKRTGAKTFTCHSFEKILENTRISFLDSVTRTLVKDDLYVHDGLLDEVIKVIPSWKLGYVDEDAKMITEMANETVTIDVFDNLVNNNVEEEGLIWEKDIVTNVDGQYAVNIDIDYHNLKTYDSEGRLLKTESLSNALNPLYANTKHIKAYHYSATGNRYGVRYVITLSDGIEYEQIHTFTNVVNKKIEGEIKLIYQTGNIVEGTRAKLITVDATNDNVLNFMNILQDQFDCVFKYDTINKVIDCYSKSNVGEDKPIELSFDTNVVSVDITPDSEVPNCLLVDSSNDISIMDMNPYGGNYLYNYKHYIDNEFFSDNLVSALNKYDEILLVKQEEYQTLKRNGDTLYSAKTKYDSEIYSIETRIKYYNNLLVGFIAAGDSGSQQEQIKNQITELEERLNECIRERMSLQEQILQVEDDMLKISEEIQKDKAVDESGGRIFTDNDLTILEEIAYTSIYEDSYYTTSYGLYNNALKVFDEMIKPQAEFTIECANLVKLMKNKLKNIIELGSFFMVDTDDIPELEEGKVRFIGYKLIPGEKKIGNTVFTNKEFKKENLNYALNIGQKVTKSTSTISSWKQVWEDAMMSNDYVSKLVEGGLNLATTQINARASRNLLDFSEYGSFWKDADNPTDGNQVYIGSSLISISTDGFKTSKLALTSEGLIAEQVIGKLLLGNKLEITTDDGRFTIGLNEDGTRMGTHVVDEYLRERIFLGLERQSDGTQIAKLELKSADGQSVVLDENGIVSEFQFCDRSAVDSTAPMRSYFRIQDNVNILKECILTVKLLPFRVHSKGMEGGGGYVQGVSTLSGGGSTSESGGGYNNVYAVTSGGENWTNPFDNYIWTTLEYLYGDDNSSHYHGLDGRTLRHTHLLNFNINVPVHSHFCPNHTHQTNLNIPSHVHPEKYGCFDLEGNDNIPSDVSLKVNGQTIRQNINGDFEINITSYLVKGKMNNIELSSATRGQIYFNLYCKSFVLW